MCIHIIVYFRNPHILFFFGFVTAYPPLRRYTIPPRACAMIFSKGCRTGLLFSPHPLLRRYTIPPRACAMIFSKGCQTGLLFSTWPIASNPPDYLLMWRACWVKSTIVSHLFNCNFCECLIIKWSRRISRRCDILI